MLKVQWNEEGKITRATVYESVQDAANGEDVKLFLDFLIEQGEDIDIEEIKSELETCDYMEELHAVFKKYFDYSWIRLEVAHLDYEVWVSHINKYGCHGPEVSDSWLMLETDDLEEAKARARDEYKANSDYVVELRSNIHDDWYDLVDFKEYNESIFNVYDFADAEYDEDSNTCDLKFHDKTWDITAYIHNVPIPEWLKTEEDGELAYIFDDVDWQSDKAIEYALEHGIKEIVRDITDF